jgi:hypothetical protein
MPATPHTLTREVTQKIAAYVTAGATIPSACALAGVPWGTAKKWLQRGKKGMRGEPANKAYTAFATAMYEAQERFHAGLSISLHKASKEDWKAAAWLLERRFRKVYRPPTQRAEHTGAEGPPIMTAQVQYVLHVPQEEPEDSPGDSGGSTRH